MDLTKLTEGIFVNSVRAVSPTFPIKRGFQLNHLLIWLISGLPRVEGPDLGVDEVLLLRRPPTREGRRRPRGVGRPHPLRVLEEIQRRLDLLRRRQPAPLMAIDIADRKGRG